MTGARRRGRAVRPGRRGRRLLLLPRGAAERREVRGGHARRLGLAQSDGAARRSRSRDDGDGFDPAPTGYGTGLQGMRRPARGVWAEHSITSPAAPVKARRWQAGRPSRCGVVAMSRASRSARVAWGLGISIAAVDPAARLRQFGAPRTSHDQAGDTTYDRRPCWSSWRSRRSGRCGDPGTPRTRSGGCSASTADSDALASVQRVHRDCQPWGRAARDLMANYLGPRGWPAESRWFRCSTSRRTRSRRSRNGRLARLSAIAARPWSWCCRLGRVCLIAHVITDRTRRLPRPPIPSRGARSALSPGGTLTCCSCSCALSLASLTSSSGIAERTATEREQLRWLVVRRGCDSSVLRSCRHLHRTVWHSNAERSRATIRSSRCLSVAGLHRSRSHRPSRSSGTGSTTSTSVVKQDRRLRGRSSQFITVVYVAIVAVGSRRPSAAIGPRRAALMIAAAIGLSSSRSASGRDRFANRLVYGKRATPYEVIGSSPSGCPATYATEDVLRGWRGSWENRRRSAAGVAAASTGACSGVAASWPTARSPRSPASANPRRRHGSPFRSRIRASSSGALSVAEAGERPDVDRAKLDASRPRAGGPRRAWP